MRISTKLMLGVLVPGLVALVVCAGLVWSYRVMEVAHENSDKIREVRNSLTELDHLLFAYVVYREERPKQQFLAECDSLASLIAGIRLRDPGQYRLLEDVRTTSQGMKDMFLRLASASDLSDPEGTDDFSKEVEERLEGQLLTRSHRADSSASRLKQLVDEDMKNTQEGTLAVLFLVLVLTAIPLTFMLLRTRTSITESLGKLHKGTAVVRSGDLDHSITVSREDEIGELSHAFNQMTASLREATVSKSELEIRVAERTRDLAKANEELQLLSSRLMTAQEDERKRIASDLHDTIGGCLVGVKFKVESAIQQIRKAPELAAGSLDGILPRVQEAIEECRRIQLDLRPSMIDDLGLLATLSWFCRTFEQTYPGIRIEQKIEIAESDIPDALKIVMFRLVQEAMNNVAKHSRADQVCFSLRKLGDRMELSLQDNGCGFSVDEKNSGKAAAKGLGLTSMKERATLSGGSFQIESYDGKGTAVTAYWPVFGNA